MVSILITWLLSALVLWLLSFIPFMGITIAGNLLSFVFVAVVIGLINAFIVPIVKGIFKLNNPGIMLVVSLVIDAAALWLASIILSGFTIGVPVPALIAAAILSVLNLGASHFSK